MNITSFFNLQYSYQTTSKPTLLRFLLWLEHLTKSKVMIFPEIIAGAKLLAGLNEPPEIGPANRILIKPIISYPHTPKPFYPKTTFLISIP